MIFFAPALPWQDAQAGSKSPTFHRMPREAPLENWAYPNEAFCFA
jgi:hypothetical protein